MIRNTSATLCMVLATLAFTSAAHAHPFAPSYNLPVPFWMYAGGSLAALLLSFFAVAWFARARNPEPRVVDLTHTRFARVLVGRTTIAMLGVISLLGLLLCIATGLLGTRSAAFNFNMTFFWIVFVIGFTYVSALIGPLYAQINPWKLIVTALANTGLSTFEGRFAYPARLGCWPALVLYAAFIAMELFGRVDPRALGVMLLGYTVLNIVGAWLFGMSAWFERCEFFGLFFSLVSRMAPLQVVAPSPQAPRGGLKLQMPFAGLLQARAVSLGEVLFVLFMLSSTAFDGLQATQVWARLFWEDFAALLAPWIGDNIVQTYPLLKPMFLGYQVASLLLSPFVYLLAYLATLAWMKRIARSEFSVRELACRFAYSLLPIALVYHATHYWTLILTQGLMVLRLASDPFGIGWNLFGTALWLHRPVIPGMDWVWHTQVGLILIGHVASVVVAHREALRVFDTPRTAALSQLPMLALMLAFTVFGLWILAQPITSNGP
ncbi:hypothetical protein DFR24_4105 [Panacagrimonas perspica]|uniref:Uncharacterized protein n=1 Tax=Panacagrimonas perspica TaxID=381431 RepID=A0A4R7NYP7_9GAMM|nr:hypothetical protein [Panacagrimonas perspica]TDU25660.1 hypothetical protein DFR24_4105 [Panacagrimonas perspica]THD03750.1 hypothetical protein B1810_07650 [Panacagrimonas perspica]